MYHHQSFPVLCELSEFVEPVTVTILGQRRDGGRESQFLYANCEIMKKNIYHEY